MTTKEHRRLRWRLRREVRALVRDTWEALLRYRDRSRIKDAFRAGDWHRYALEKMAYWRRWER